MKTRLDKTRPVDVRNNEGVLTPDGKFFPTEAYGAKTSADNTRINVPQGSAVISPKFIKAASKIASSQKPEIEKLNKILKNPNSTSLARKSAEYRIKALKAEFNPILMAEAARRGGENTVGEDGVPNAFWGAIAGVAGKLVGGQGALKSMNPLSMLAPAYNIGMGLFSKVDKLNAETYQNPYESQIRSNMANRRFNADPLLEANRTASASAAYNIRNSGMGGGALAANMLGAQNNRMRGDATAYATKQNQDNQYLQEQSVMDASLGQQRANRSLEINQINAQNKAAKQQMLATGLGQLGQAGQNAQLMSGQKDRDAMLMKSWKSFEGMLGTGNNKMAGYGQAALLNTLGGYKGSINTETIPPYIPQPPRDPWDK
jgi:hypothetical protein